MIEWEGRGAGRIGERSEPFILFVHTPFCGTCALARKMLTVAEAALPELKLEAANLNLYSELAAAYRIESVPCLLIRHPDGRLEKVYRFGSVVELMEKLKPLAGSSMEE
jgi:thiol-disulfide isomerase/thioredoxin